MATIQTKHNWLRRLAGIVLVLIFTFLLPWYLYTTIQDPTNLIEQVQLDNTPSNGDKSSDKSVKVYVDILSVPPVKAIVGEKYVYDLDIEYSGTGVLSYKLIGQPAWLRWDKAKTRLSGVPPQNSPVVVKVSLEVSDGTVDDRQNYTLILSKGRTTALPVQANNSTTDPFNVPGGVNNQAILGASTNTVKLPDTALGSWTLGIIGITLTFFGIGILYYYKSVVSSQHIAKVVISGITLKTEEDSSANYLAVERQKK